MTANIAITAGGLLAQDQRCCARVGDDAQRAGGRPSTAGYPFDNVRPPT